MKGKIAEVIKNNPIPSASSGNQICVADSVQLDELAQAILDLIAKELPKERRRPTSGGSVYIDEADGYNQCLKDIKHKLGVE